MAFGDRVIKLNDYLLEEECKKEDERCRKQKSGRIPIQLKSVANLSNQLLRAGTSIGANNAESISAISKQDYRSKSFIALKEADETAYWRDLLQATDYIDKKLFDSLNSDCTEIIKMLTAIIKTLKEK